VSVWPLRLRPSRGEPATHARLWLVAIRTPLNSRERTSRLSRSHVAASYNYGVFTGNTRWNTGLSFCPEEYLSWKEHYYKLPLILTSSRNLQVWRSILLLKIWDIHTV